VRKGVAVKTIRASVDLDGRVTLAFGWDKALVDFVKEVSGFYWVKARHIWMGALHSLAALDFAAKKRGDVQVVVSWPTLMAPPCIVQSNFTLRDYQSWVVGVLLTRREFLLCWSPRVGKTTAVIHAGATGIATRQFERVLVVPPANVTAEWSRQLALAFPGMNFFELEGQPLETEKRKASFEKTIENEVKKARAKRIASAEKAFKKKWAKQWAGSPLAPVPSPEQLAACRPSEEELMKREQEVRDRLEKKWGKAIENDHARVVESQAAHFIACQHDLVSPRSETLFDLAALGPFALCVDEVQLFTDEKAPRSKALIALAKHKNCRKVWTTSGTPMRNRPEDLVVFYELMGGIGSGKWGYLKRYAGAFEGVYGWETGGETNLDEAAARFSSVSHRLTREQVKNDLPAIDRKVTLCPLSREEGQRYKALEAALGKKAMQGYGAEKTQALRTLVSSVLAVKLEAALERVLFHVAQRGVKVLVGANFHESLQAFAELIAARFPGSPFYVAGGWMGPDRRTAVVDAWKADPRPTPLLVNVLSSGVGIDLSDAEGTIILEIPWVPSDALQFEARILDVHLGKRTSPPWVEYLLAAGTVDEDMALANLKKIGVVDAVVGGERESRALALALRESGVVSQVDLGLVDKSDGAVEAALEGLRRRLSGQVLSTPEASGLSTAALVGAVEEAFDDEEESDDDRDAALADASGAG